MCKLCAERSRVGVVKVGTEPFKLFAIGGNGVFEKCVRVLLNALTKHTGT